MSSDKFKKIKSSDAWISVTPLDKGWSKDRKYVVLDKNNAKYLIRISSISLMEKKKKQFELLKKLEELVINISKPMDFGILNDEEIFMMFTYLDGDAAEGIVSGLSDEKAYALGFESGKMLQKLHDIPLEEAEDPWWDKYQKKIARKIEVFNNCNLDIPDKRLLVNYIKEHLYLMKNRQQKFCHGDYHLGNMIIKDDKIGIIDLDKSNVGDPYDDFKPFCWNVFQSEYFETGLVNGYFDNHVPDDFWNVLALYAAESIISHLPWAAAFGEEETKTAYKVMNSILDWYDDFNSIIPSWYKGKI